MGWRRIEMGDEEREARYAEADYVAAKQARAEELREAWQEIVSPFRRLVERVLRRLA